MLDGEKLQEYVESFYGLEDEDYRVRCDSGENFFQIAVQHEYTEDAELEELVDNIFTFLAMEKEEWDFEYDQKGDHSFVYAGKNYEEPVL